MAAAVMWPRPFFTRPRPRPRPHLARSRPRHAHHFCLAFLYRVTQKKIPPYGNLNILAMLCWITTKIYGIAKEIIWHMWAKFHVYTTCGSKVMALLLKKHVFHFYMPNFFFITGLKTGNKMKKHKMIYEHVSIKFRFDYW